MIDRFNSLLRYHSILVNFENVKKRFDCVPFVCEELAPAIGMPGHLCQKCRKMPFASIFRKLTMET